MSFDAVIVGAGHNGLVAANLLADRGWGVVVVEDSDTPGGAVRSAELIEPGYVNDVFSAFHPFALASPHIRGLDLERWGLRWRTSEVAVAHPTRDGTCPVVALDIERTAASLDAFAPGDGAAWRELYELWERVRRGALGAFFSPFPPLRPALELLRALGPRELLRFTRFSLLPVRRMGEEVFAGDGGPRLLGGNALHADVPPEAPLSGAFGWVLCSLAQQHGFPSPEGGAGQLTAALVKRLESKGGQVIYGQRAVAVEHRGGRAVAVRTEDSRYPAERAVIADVSAPALYGELLDPHDLPARTRQDLRRFEFDPATFKVDWTLDGPIPWTAKAAREAAAIHVAEGMDALTRASADLACRTIARDPYLVMGQYSHFDPTRAPAGKETAWAYTHLPHRPQADARGELEGRWDEREADLMANRIEEQVEALAPGFRDLIRGRHIFTPPRMQAANRNLPDGALNGGTAQLYQQLVFRPVPGLARAETPLRGLYLGSASAHPGGGVHGGPGANAARAALAEARSVPTPARALGWAQRRLQG